MKAAIYTGTIQTKTGRIKQVATRLSTADIMGAIAVRWRIKRNNYVVEPGLYAVGNPVHTSDVFVSANYKLSFDHLRKNLDGLNAWILVLDTKGINVWCAAGKGTFGTAELVNRINQTGLSGIISHRRLILPQLGATGVSAYRVKALTSAKNQEESVKSKILKPDFASVSDLKVEREFNVIFGPVRAADIKAFIANGYKTTADMRKVTFNFYDRVKLIPVDFVYAGPKLLIAFAVIALLSGFDAGGINLIQIIDKGLPAMLYILLAYFSGILLTPVFLPYIPVRMFGFKGLITGFFLAAVLYVFRKLGESPVESAALFLLIMAVSSFMAMNFTGSSTFTSLSGVKKEMRTFVPVQISFAAAGLILFVVSNFKS